MTRGNIIGSPSLKQTFSLENDAEGGVRTVFLFSSEDLVATAMCRKTWPSLLIEISARPSFFKIQSESIVVHVGRHMPLRPEL